MPTASAAARATAIDTPSMALAPSLPLLGVPSSAIIARSIDQLVGADHALQFRRDELLDVLHRLAHALAAVAALASPSRSSLASCSPVEAPLGTAARPGCRLRG